MKAIYHVMLALLPALLLAGCGQVSERGEQLAARLSACRADTAAVRRLAADYRAAADSLHIPGTAGQMAAAFIRAAGADDSLRALAQAIALDADDFAKQEARPLVDALLDGTVDARQATDRLFTLHWAADMLDRTDYIATLDRAIDEAAGRLSAEKQMLLYSRAAAPAELAKRMRAEREQSGADTADLDRRATMLKDIYASEQLAEFQAVYEAGR